MDKQQAMSMLNCSVDQNNFNLKANTTDNQTQGYFNQTSIGQLNDINGTSNLSCWRYWQDFYYPYVIRESYPVYIQERSLDRGKKAFEIIKILKDKKLIKVEKVSDFIDCMDELIKIL